jgi:hypothetical protein
MMFIHEQAARIFAALLVTQTTAGSLKHHKDFDWSGNNVGFQSVNIDGLGPSRIVFRPKWTVTAARNDGRFGNGKKHEYEKHGSKRGRYFIDSNGEQLSDPSPIRGCAIEFELAQFDFNTLDDPVEAKRQLAASKTSATCEGSLQDICNGAITAKAKELALQNIGKNGGDLCRKIAEMDYPEECYDFNGQRLKTSGGAARARKWHEREKGDNGNRHSMRPQWSRKLHSAI